MRKRVLLAIILAVIIAAVSSGVLVSCQGKDAGATGGDVRRGLIPRIEAPDFTLFDVEGNSVSLKDLRGKYVVLFFSGGLRCLPCIPQIGELGKEAGLNNDQTLAFSVIPDARFTWEEALEVPSLAHAKPLFDTDGKVFQDYAALDVSSLMRQGLHMAHTYFVIDRDGIIATVMDDPAMAVRNDVLVPLLNKLVEIESEQP